ncbi:cobyrinate a,c-diamide synthase [Luteibacter sp. UNCMF366Tsu5.1]|uniref:cobyrinate a,c-diamide synthase n=1 Tax=Luteibacter sp. UNCMF366Tsu5.1 TaxID=1502758 RepID=UPI0009090D5C|nr:cobyrinate a,c-diamide synthase [Luteibacter sp. UNCMF366Tsu5.1]SFW75303.1 cobyrinic acid a,c-diamide synthase [Luteibacter sp. UNCMF366Tsu5.1]
MSRDCPALFVSAPASGQGKTSVTAALARAHARRGKRVRVFKTGPDFLDPTILARASGAPVYQLDPWMGGDGDVRARLYEAAGDADLILVEGVMGLFDGSPSSADLAIAFGLPVLAVIDGSAMAQTFGALAHGLATYRPSLRLSGVLANRVGSAYHAGLLRDSLPAGVDWYGALPRDAALTLPERHLGLVAAAELDDLDARLDALADAWEAQDRVPLPPPVIFDDVVLPASRVRLDGVRIAVAQDAAFAFLYPANIDLLREAGAELLFFSPLAGDPLPACDAVWLPGGYPELHIDTLAARDDLRRDLRAHVDAGRPLLAECGGLLYALDRLADREGHTGTMAGLLEGHATMQPRLAALGMQEAALPEGVLRGHSFHYAQASIGSGALATAHNPHGGPTAERIYRRDRMTASFVHFYFPSQPDAAVRLFLP